MASTVTHRVHPVSDQRKGDLLTHVLKETPGAQALVFCKTKHGSNRVGQYLERAGINAAVIHGNQEPGRAHQGARRLQGRSRHRIGGHRPCRARPRHRAVAAGRELRSAAGGVGLHSPRRPHGRAGLSAGPSRWSRPRIATCCATSSACCRRRSSTSPSTGFAVTASSHEALPDAGRRHQGRRPSAALAARGRVSVTDPVDPDAVRRDPQPASNAPPPLRKTRSGARTRAIRTRGWRHRYRRGR